MSNMKGVKQTTLFQSWGNQKKETVLFSDNVERAAAATTVSDNFEKAPLLNGTSGNDLEDGVIDLCDSFEDGDDELLYQAEETLNLNNQDHGHNSRDTNDRNTGFDDNFAPEHGENEEENECNISVGAEHFTLTQRQSMCKNLPGFDICAGKMWIYPTNYPVRDYQYNIVHQSLFKNTMVTLPTGLGKTFIAAVVMYNFYRWYPQGKVVFMAPTKPLVAQQIEACYNIMGIPQDHTAEMTGSMGPPKREKAWQEKRVFFLTPQVLTNDLSRGSCPAEDVKCLVIDEAHKALGNHAYCQVVRELVKYTENFRVLALSATPGSDIKAVQQVLTNLLISHIEIRTEESIDIKQYSHERKVEKVVVPLGEELTKVKEKYVHIMDVVVSRLKRQGVLYNRDTSSLSKFLILKSRDAFRQNPPERLPRSQYGVVEADYALAMSLYHGFELLQLHGSRSLFNFLEGILSGDKGHGRTRAELTRNGDFTEVMALLAKRYSSTASEVGSPGDPKKFLTGHPKMEKLQDIVLEHFNKFQAQGMSATRVMIFSQYRDSVQEITDMLNVHRPLVKGMSFIGQSSAGKATKGFTQKEQLKVMKQFREGGYNTLVSTCVGEEGLDIGDVDLIICFDAHKSPIRLVQRMGRTGRKREGRIVMLVTQGKEEQIYNQSQYSKRSIHKAILNGARSLHFYQHSPRMVPEQLDPRAHKMYITVKESFKPSKRVSTEPKGDQSKITSLFDNAKKSEKNEVISAEEYQELGDWFVDSIDVPTLPKPCLMCLDKRDNNEVNREGPGARLSLSEWSPWQNTLQQYEKIDHSMGTKHLVQIMEFIQLQESLDPGDDPYGLEMAAYLNEDDILKPGESEMGPDNILKYCVTKKPENSSDGKVSKLKKKPLRRSDVLKDIDDHKGDESSDDDLPAFALSPDKHEIGDNEVDNPIQEILNDNNENSIINLETTERPGDHKGLSKNSSKLVITSKKTIGSRAKSLERKMSEDILRKSKKRKRSKVSLNHTRIVDLIADNDSNDFDDDGNHIVSDVNDIQDNEIQNENTDYKVVQNTKQTDHTGGTKSQPNVIHIDDNFNAEYYKVCSAPSVEDAIAHCEGLDDTHFLDRMDLTDLLDENEKENLRKRTYEYDSCVNNSLHKDIKSYRLDNEESYWTTKLLKYNFCEEDGFQSFLEVKRENDIVLKKLFSDNKHKTTDNFKDSTLPLGISKDRKQYSKNLTNTSEKSDSDAHVTKRSPTSSVRLSHNSLHLDNNIRPSSSKAMIQNDSWLGSAEDEELALACRTQNLPGTNGKDLKPTQVTFTQALACIHSSNSSETDTVSGNPKVVSNSHGKLADSQDSEDSLKNLSMPEFCLQGGEKEKLNSTGQFSMKEVDMDYETYQEANNEQNCPLENEKRKDKRSSDGKEGPILRDFEQTVTELEDKFSDDETDIPQFDLGFDFDEDIIPPSPNATQQSQKGVSKFISQPFSHRLSQSVLNAQVSDDNERTKKDSIKEETNCNLNLICKNAKFKQSLDFSSDRRKQETDFKAESKDSGKIHAKTNYCSNLEDIPEFSDNGSDFESEIVKDKPNCKNQSQKNLSKSDEKEKEHEEVLKIAEFVSSQEPVGEPSFCLMDGDDLGDWFDSEPELTENTDLDKCNQNNTDVENDNSNGRSVSGMNEKKQNSVPLGSSSHNHANKADDCKKSNICNKATAGNKQPLDNVTEATNPMDDIQEYSEVFIKTITKLKTPVSKFKTRKSTFTVDDFSPDPFNDSFDFDAGNKQSADNVTEGTNPKDDIQEYSKVFNKTISKLKTPKTPVSKFKTRKSTFSVDDFSPDPLNNSFDFLDINYSKSVNTMTSLKAKVKTFSIASSTPKVSNKIGPSQLKANFDSNTKSKSEQNKNLQSESESDDSFIVRKKKKPCIIESPCSQIEKEKELNNHTEESTFITPFRERILNRGKNMNSKLYKKKLSVSFSDDDDFDNAEATMKRYFPPKSMAIISEGSSDEDFDEPLTRKKRNDKSDSSDKSLEQSSPPQKMRKKRGSNPFIEEEAELSEDEHYGSSDESEHGLDHYEASFIHDTEQLSQSQGINPTQMQAVYMKSVRSPTGPGRFKLQYDYKHTDVFSQIPEEESQYMEDSFCVGEEEDDWLGGYEEKLEPMEVTVMHPDVTVLKTGRTRRQRGVKKVIESGIERARHQGRMKALDKLKSKIASKNKNKLAQKSGKIETEAIPMKSTIQINDDFSSEDESKRATHPLSDFESPEIKTKQKRLKTKIFSSSDEEERGVTENVATVNNGSADLISDDFAQSGNRNHTKLKEKTGCSITSKSNQGANHSIDSKSNQFDPDLLMFDSDKSKNISKGVILVDSKEISGSQDIISDLRFKHSIHVSAAQLPGCDYIISNRMAVERKQWSEFSNGANREKLTERIQALKDLYDRPILIVEKDRVKPGEEKHQRPLHWTKYVDKTIALLLRSSVKVLYTDNQKETATLLSDLCQLEMRKRMGITAQVDLNTDQQNYVKFFANIPKLSYIHALNLAHGFKSVSNFMKSSIQEIQSKGQMSENRAVDVYKFLRRQFDADMLSK